MNHIKKSLDNFMERLGQQAFGRSRRECWEKGLCITCGQRAEPRISTEAGRHEYSISCMCEVCFDETFKEEE